MKNKFDEMAKDFGASVEAMQDAANAKRIINLLENFCISSLQDIIADFEEKPYWQGQTAYEKAKDILQDAEKSISWLNEKFHVDETFNELKKTAGRSKKRQTRNISQAGQK